MFETITKKVRLEWWLVTGIFKRYQVAIISSFVIAIILVLLGIRYGRVVLVTIQNETKIIGLTGSFTPTTLPITIQRLISSGLTDVTVNGEAVPSLSLSWETNSANKEYIFHLRSDLYWHDGKKFTAYDVNYNLKDVVFSPLDDKTLKVTLKEPFIPLPNFLSKPLFRKGLVGVGSYKIDAIKLKGENVSYLRLKPLTSELPYLEFKFYPSETLTKTAFKLGEVNVLDELTDPSPFSSWKSVSWQENVKPNQYVGIFFNLSLEKLDAKEVRQALNFAVLKQEKNRVATPLSTLSWAYTNRVKQYEQDIEQAKKLLNGEKSFELTLSTFPEYQELAERISASWTEIGIPTKVKVESGIPTEFEAFIVTQEIPSDPDQYALWHSTQISSSNMTGYISHKIDKLLEDGRKEPEKEKRQKIYADFQRYLVEDTPVIFLFHPTTYTVSRK